MPEVPQSTPAPRQTTTEGRAGWVRRWRSVLVPLLAAGLIAGLGLLALLNGTPDANIGLGLFILIGLPVIAVLLLWSLARAIWLITRRRRSISSPADS